MRLLLASLAVLTIMFATGCSDEPGGEEEAEVRVVVGASNRTPEVDDQIVLNADVTTEGDARFISFNWITTSGPALPSFQNSSNTLTLVRFPEPGIYRIIMRVYWWDEDNERKTTDAGVTIDVPPPAPVSGG